MLCILFMIIEAKVIIFWNYEKTLFLLYCASNAHHSIK